MRRRSSCSGRRSSRIRNSRPAMPLLATHILIDMPTMRPKPSGWIRRSTCAEQAIALDPRQARGYSGLARALNYKGLDTEARVLTTKALELAPNDVEAIRRAIYQAAETGHFDEEYRLLRRCHVLEPNDPFAPYNLSQICAAVGEPRLMEKWMQSALNLEFDAQRHRLLECERLIFRQDFKGAAAGLRDLPLDFRAYKYYRAAAARWMFAAHR